MHHVEKGYTQHDNILLSVIDLNCNVYVLYRTDTIWLAEYQPFYCLCEVNVMPTFCRLWPLPNARPAALNTAGVSRVRAPHSVTCCHSALAASQESRSTYCPTAAATYSMNIFISSSQSSLAFSHEAFTGVLSWNQPTTENTFYELFVS